MGSVIRSRAVSPELWWFQFSGDVDITSAYDTSKYTFAGADQTLLLPLQVFFGDTADSVFVKTPPGTEQDYTITISGLLDLSGDIIEDIIWSLMPKVLPAYPSVGILDLLTDGEGWGAKLRAQTEHHESLSGISGFVGETEYPFTQSPENSSLYEFDTSQLEEPVEEFAIRPLVAPGHEGEFTEDQTADLVVSLLIARLPPELDNLRLLNPERERDDTVTIIDGIITVGDMKPWRNYRGAELMIARLGDPEDLIPILPYYPPGANDPNDPNYDPEAPEDGSANPPWWIGPALPDKLPFFPWSEIKPPGIELIDPGDCDPGFREPPIGPPEILIPPVEVQFPQIDISEHDLPAGDHAIIARIYNESNDYNEYTIPLRIDPPVSYPSLVTRGKNILVKRMSDIVAGFDLIAGGQEYPFIQDAKDPDAFSLDTSNIPPGIHDFRTNYEAGGSDILLLTLREFVSRHRIPYFFLEDLLGEGRRVNPSDNVRIRMKIEDILPIKGVDFWLKPIVEGGWGMPKVMLGSATESEEEEGVFELDASLAEATKDLPEEEFQVGADVTKADDTTSEEPAGSAEPTKHPKPDVDETYKSPNCKNRPEGQEIDLIVLHHTVGDFESTKNTFMKPDPDNGVSAHFVVDKEGNVFQMVDEEKVAWHAGKASRYEGGTGVNNRSIGIEFVNKGDGVDEYTPAQIAAGRELVDYLRDKYNITDGEDHVVGHKEVHSGKIDPSENFPWLEVVPDGLAGNERTTGRKKSKPT
ncbi:N-acetylmuramoyl-L-alanine amidase [bacterium]|nr:N-acetylmuramoyl-L-alanine amidase [bacterium]